MKSTVVTEASGVAAAGAAAGTVGGSGALLTLVTCACLALICVYCVHLVTSLRRQRFLRESKKDYKQYCDTKDPGKQLNFLIVTFMLPFGISAISVLATFLRPDGATARPDPVWASVFWGMANVVFVLMITLLISYLYDRPVGDWRPALTASLVLDILSYLVFVIVFSDPQRWAAGNVVKWYHQALLAGVGVASFTTSFTVIYCTRSLDKFIVSIKE